MSEPTTFELERMALGEIPTPPEHEEAVARLRASNEEILAQYPAGEFAPADPKSGEEGRRTPAVVWASGGALLAAAAAVLLLIGPPQEPRPAARSGPARDGIRLKGPKARLQVWRATPDGQTLLETGSAVAPGDVVQPKFGVSSPGYGLVFSVDGRGETTRIHPDRGERAERMKPGALQAARFSMELDDAPDFERFYFVVCEESFETGPMMERIIRGRDSTPEACTLESVELKKR